MGWSALDVHRTRASVCKGQYEEGLISGDLPFSMRLPKGGRGQLRIERSLDRKLSDRAVVGIFDEPSVLALVVDGLWWVRRLQGRQGAHYPRSDFAQEGTRSIRV